MGCQQQYKANLQLVLFISSYAKGISFTFQSPSLSAEE
jgi:hypothetical protein